MLGRHWREEDRLGVARFYAVTLRSWRPWLGVVLLLAAALAAWRGEEPVLAPASVPLVAGLDARKPVYVVPVQERLISFAVNVDWGDEYLPGMLSVLAERGVRVTFFPTGRWAAGRPELLRRMVEGGHELGNHGYRHDHPKALTDQQLAELIVRNRELLAELAGVQTVLFAPPYGEVDPRIVRIAAETGHWTIMWTVDTVDWRRPPPETIVQRVLSRVQPGAIVLMHPTAPTLAALPVILDRLLSEGWRVVPVGELLAAAAPRSATTGLAGERRTAAAVSPATAPGA